jgi:glycosyltransferase involved in cell wall biosynthesis
MTLTVIIPTLGRKALVNQILDHLERQTRAPDEVIVSTPDATHVEPYQGHRLRVEYVFGKKGLPSQRNRGLEHALGRSDIITFFDDDFVPADNYLERVEATFEEHPDCAVVAGYIARDGAQEGGLTFEQGLVALRSIEAGYVPHTGLVDRVGAHGSNFSIRCGRVGDLRFDERLVLHGWQEDIDFTAQMRQHGRVASKGTLVGVHLGVRGGKASGTPFGYSQIMNLVYLVRKGTVPWTFALPIMSRNVAANLIRSLWSEPYIDRRGRLKGNLLAAYHVITGRIEPEYILKL